MAVAMVATVVTVVGTGAGTSFAISDGHYRYFRNDCKGYDFNSSNPNYVDPSCTGLILSISDYNGHEYFGMGIPETANGTAANAVDFWADPGQGQDISWTVSESGGISNVDIEPSTQPAADPTSGLRLYFGADDNLNVGEHDSSGYTNNGPSDGGAIAVNIDPATAGAWITSLQADNLAYLLTHPTPLINGGFGACADGFCFSFTLNRKVAYQGLDTAISRDAADYVWSNGSPMVWKPYDCSGPTDGSDGSNVCADPALHSYFGATNPCYNSNGYMTIACWNELNGTVYVQPGVQIYEDPDPQASPGVVDLAISANGILPQVYNEPDPYPWPALYAGTCGVVIGGGPSGSPTDLSSLPGTNAAGQYVYSTGC